MTFAYTCIDHGGIYFIAKSIKLRTENRVQNPESLILIWFWYCSFVHNILNHVCFNDSYEFYWLATQIHTTYLQHIFELNCKLIIPVENSILITRNSNAARIANIFGQCSFDLNWIQHFIYFFFFKFKSYSHDDDTYVYIYITWVKVVTALNFANIIRNCMYLHNNWWYIDIH